MQHKGNLCVPAGAVCVHVSLCLCHGASQTFACEGCPEIDEHWNAEPLFWDEICSVPAVSAPAVQRANVAKTIQKLKTVIVIFTGNQKLNPVKRTFKGPSGSCQCRAI